MGRQTLMLPLEWTDDHWFRVPEGIKSSDPLKTSAGKPSIDGTALSDDFSGENLGLQWQFFRDYDPSRVKLKEEKLFFKGKGKSFADSSPLLINPSDRRYEVVVEYTIRDGNTAGLCL